MVSAGWAYSVAISRSTVESQLLLADVKHVHQCTDVCTDTGFKALECCEVRIDWDGIKRLYQQCGNLLGKCSYMYRKYIYCIVPHFIMHYKLNLVFQFLWDSLNANLYSFTDYQPTVGSTQAGGGFVGKRSELFFPKRIFGEPFSKVVEPQVLELLMANRKCSYVLHSQEK